MKDKYVDVVTVSRHWNNPEIQIQVVVNKKQPGGGFISLSMSLADFIEALKEEIGSVTLTFTSKQFSEKIEKAVHTVIGKVKEESKKVM